MRWWKQIWSWVQYRLHFNPLHSTQYRLYSTILTSLHNFDTDTEKKITITTTILHNSDLTSLFSRPCLEIKCHRNPKYLGKLKKQTKKVSKFVSLSDLYDLQRSVCRIENFAQTMFWCIAYRTSSLIYIFAGKQREWRECVFSQFLYF